MLTRKSGIPLVSFQIKPAAAVMARAFHNDPFFTYVFPEPLRRAHILPWLFERTITYGLRYGKVYTTASLEGVALWLGPEKPGLSWMGTLLTGLFLLPLQLSWQELKCSMRLAKIAGRLHKKSVNGRHWYLLGLGTEPSLQGQGVAGALLQPVLASADRERLVCYLDTNNALNIPFYERVGFIVTGHAQSSQASPGTWSMRREPGC
jgi:ribosomal protein S18 acetylase RimI-like enzyme